MISVSTLWKFARPHTIIGTVMSICTLYAMVCNGNFSKDLLLLFGALVVGITCNIYIVGTNQIHDIELDKINKPYLALASGALNIKQANRIIYTSVAICLIVSASLSMLLLGIVSFSMAIGWAYSNPPLYLRKHHIPAAISIATVRGLMVNLGGYLVFNKIINGNYFLSPDIKILCIFILAFSICIAWFKDLPDMEGDAKFKIKSLALIYSARFTLIAGNILVVAAYVYSLFYFANRDVSQNTNRTNILLYGHIVLLIGFLANTIIIGKLNKVSMKKFYQRFWLFFFAEYIVYLIAFIYP